MLVNVAEILKDYGEKIIVNGDVVLDDTEFLGERFVFTGPVHVEGSLINNGKALEFHAHARGEMNVHCARCGRELTVPLEFPIDEVLTQDDGTMSAQEDVVMFTGTDIDIRDIAVNHFLMNVQGKYLCKEDCRGLCSKCGKDLNDGPCGCADDEIDPRWAALAEIMKQSSEE